MTHLSNGGLFSISGLPPILVAGLIVLVGLFAGRLAARLRMPTPIGYMLVGVLLGPALLGVISQSLQISFGFLQDLGLGFVALAIGLELNRQSIKGDGRRILLITTTQALATFIVTGAAIALISGNVALGLLFGAIATATAPAGTVAVIREYHARGPVTRTLYAVVGLDDGMAIVIYAFASAVAAALVAPGGGGIGAVLLAPVAEIVVSVLIGAVLGTLFAVLARPLIRSSDLFVLTVAIVLLTVGAATLLHGSLIMSAMIVGMVVTNTQSTDLVHRIGGGISGAMPVLFVLFFALAGSHLDIAGLPRLGLVGLTYVAARSIGKLGGSWLGGAATKASPAVRRYLGLALLAQAGVAIGLALKAHGQFSGLGTEGAWIATVVITTVTAATIIFELVGPILAKLALSRAGEIPDTSQQ